MICERVIGSAAETDDSIDWIEIDWRQTVRRAMRLVSANGIRVDVLLPRGSYLRTGDVLTEMNGIRIAVQVMPIDLLVIQPTRISQTAQFALELGLLHVPVEMDRDNIITLDDGPTIELADRYGIRYSRIKKAFHPMPASMMVELTDRRRIGKSLQ